MFKTKDGFSVNLRDTVYVIFNRYKINKRGKHYQSRDNFDVMIYKLEVCGIRAQTVFDRDCNNIDVYYADGIAYDIDDLLPDGNAKGNAPCFFNVYASPLNTFAKREVAEAAFPEFRRRGLINILHSVHFADELVCNALSY